MKPFLILFFTLSMLGNAYTQQSIRSLVLQKVNILRDSLDLSPLSGDQILDEASEDQAYYMAQKKTLTHFQGTFSKETPSERILYYGGNRTYSGENVAYVGVQWKSKNHLNDSAIAENLFQQWFHSPGHYANMIHPEFTKMGLSYWLGDDNRVYAAQVFSSNEIQLPKAFKNSDLSWGVRPSELTCKDEPVRYETMYFANSVEVDGNSVYFYFHDLDFFQNVISSDNDGLAIDVVLREQLPCNRENQFHISKVYDGEMQRPIYKNDIYRNNIAKNPKKIRIKIGEVPNYLSNQQWEANVIIINDNKLCDYSVPVEVPSDIFPLLPIRPYYETNDPLNASEKLPLIRIKDSMHVELLYERSQQRFFAKSDEQFRKLLDWSPFIDSIHVDCFASVEGATWFNLQLLENRKNSVYSLLERNFFNTERINFSSAENWEMMHGQIEKHQLTELARKSDPQLKYYFKKHSSEFYDSLLFEQRKTHIYATVDTFMRPSSFEDFQFIQSYDSSLTFSDLPWNKILREEYILNDFPISVHLIDSLKDKERYRTNLLGAASIDWSYGDMDSTLTEQFVKKVDSKNHKQLFNYANFLTRYWFTNFSRKSETEGVAITISPNRLLQLIEPLDQSSLDTNQLKRLKVNILLSGIHYYVAHNNWKPVNDYFDQIVTLVKSGDFTPLEAMELALFCNHFHRFQQAVDIMHPFHEEQSLSEDAYFVLAQTSTLIRQKLDSDTYHTYMQSAKRANHRRYCNWLDDEFQIQRDEYVKRDFCSSCK